MSDFKKQKDGSYRIFGKNGEALAMCPIPAWVTAEQMLAVGADMKPTPKPKRVGKPSKKKPEAALDGGA